MRYVTLIIPLLLAACTTHRKHDEAYGVSSVVRFADSAFAHTLTSLLTRIERGDLAAWRQFASYIIEVDGEHAESYSIACVEITRRDPTFYLRRYLAGDRIAITIGRKAYRWSGTQGRSLLDSIYARRLEIADDKNERRQIQFFIDQTARGNRSDTFH